jgi:hypothetical protein
LVKRLLCAPGSEPVFTMPGLATGPGSSREAGIWATPGRRLDAKPRKSPVPTDAEAAGRFGNAVIERRSFVGFLRGLLGPALLDVAAGGRITVWELKAKDGLGIMTLAPTR